MNISSLISMQASISTMQTATRMEEESSEQLEETVSHESDPEASTYTPSSSSSLEPAGGDFPVSYGVAGGTLASALGSCDSMLGAPLGGMSIGPMEEPMPSPAGLSLLDQMRPGYDGEGGGLGLGFEPMQNAVGGLGTAGQWLGGNVVTPSHCANSSANNPALLKME